MLSMNGDCPKSVKRMMRKVIRRTGRMILCHLLYPQVLGWIACGSLDDKRNLNFETIIYVLGRTWNFESADVFDGGNHGAGAFDHSDGENFPVAGQRMETQLSSAVPKPTGNFVRAKLVAWKDAQVAKLLEK
jgi:hypothetical protein